MIGYFEHIYKLPMQYYTFLEEAGNGLSGREKQRISSFDMAYYKLKKKSMLIVAHRLATVKNCDEIIVMDGGFIVEQGSHEELLALKGKYYQLWEMQQGNFKIEEDEEIPLLQEIVITEDEISYT